MPSFKTLFTSTFTFLKQSPVYFRSVILMHGFLLLICLPLLGKACYFILVHNQIQFLALSNLPTLIHQHPIALSVFLGIGLSTLLLAFFELTFLLLSVYFIQIKQPLPLQTLLKMTFTQIAHLRNGTVLFFLYYYVLIMPWSAIDCLLSDSQFNHPTVIYTSLKRNMPFSGSLWVLVAIISLVGVGVYNWHTLHAITIHQPLSISHRGVSQRKGVQNSLTALNQTHRLKPNYVEMDVQLTKDRQFVVFHDFQLAPLTGYSGTPQSKTLAQLTKMTVREHQQTAPIASFDDYLARANQCHQKLLIEIKTPTTDNPELVRHFLNKYQANIEAHGHMVQSLNWHVVEAVKQAAPKIQTGYILPFNFSGPPISSADFYAVEMTTVNRHFIQAAHQENKAVFVWTSNDYQAVHRMMYFGADGVITDNLKAVEQAKSRNKQFHYAEQLAYYVIGIG